MSIYIMSARSMATTASTTDSALNAAEEGLVVAGTVLELAVLELGVLELGLVVSAGGGNGVPRG